MTPENDKGEEPATGNAAAPAGRILIKGPSGTGKTLACAQALMQYIQQNGPQGVTVLEFAPSHVQENGKVLGHRLDHFMSIPEGVLHFVVPTRAPRAGSTSTEEALEIARMNAEACRQVLTLLPDQISALFVNDATMAFHVPGTNPSLLIERMHGAGVAVLTALDPIEFAAEHPITIQERSILESLARSVDHVVQTAPPAAQGDPARMEAESAARSDDKAPGGGPHHG